MFSDSAEAAGPALSGVIGFRGVRLDTELANAETSVNSGL